MSSLKHCSKLANRQIAGKQWEIIRHHIESHRGLVVLTETQTAAFPVEECAWCGGWVPTISRLRSVEQASTAKFQDTMLPDGSKIREMIPGSDRMVCYDCYEVQKRVIQKSQKVEPQKSKIPYAKISEV